MKVTQIASILNAVYGELLGGDTIPNPNYNPEASEDATNPKVIANPNMFKEDLSNIVDVGAKITSTTQWGDNFDKYVGRIIDKVGRVIFRDRVYTGQGLGLRREDAEYGSVVEKVRVEVGEFKLNSALRMTGSILPDGTSVAAKTDYSHLFDFDSPAEVEAIYFNILDTYQLDICIPKDQMKGAFRSAGEMQRLFGMITNRIMNKFQVALEALDEGAEANFIGAKIHYNSNVVDLLALYNNGPNAGGTALSVEAALESPEFLRFCVRKIKTDKKLLAKFSGKYNKDNYGTHSPDDRLKVFALTDFATAMETVLKSNTYHDNFVALDGYREVPYWQASSDDSFESRSSINATVVTKMSGLGKVDRSTDIADVSRSGIVFIMQDIDAVMTGSTQLEVDQLYNPDGKFFKYFYEHRVKFYNDLSENGIIYTIGTGSANVYYKNGTLTLAKGSNAGDTKIASGLSIEGATSYKTTSAAIDELVEVGIGVAAPSDFSTSVTAGTTVLAATAGQYVQVIGLDANSKVVGVVATQATADVIK